MPANVIKVILRGSPLTSMSKDFGVPSTSTRSGLAHAAMRVTGCQERPRTDTRALKAGRSPSHPCKGSPAKSGMNPGANSSA
ncbi:MAG: hypothetical protein AB1512_20260 [Thermodesulfobacteriota bacterium]